MALHVPFRNLSALLPQPCAGEAEVFDELQIRKDMELEAYSDDHIATVLAWIRAQRRLAERYLQGELDAEEEVNNLRVEARAPHLALDACQLRLKALIDKNVQRSVEARDANDDETYETMLQAAQSSSILAALGPPGSGKTAAIHACVDKWKACGARILLALPTGQLAAEMRARHPDVDIDTCHGAFLFHKDLNEALPILTQYDLVVIDELSMLSAEHMDRLGDMGVWTQLPGPQKNPSKVSDSAAWRAFYQALQGAL